jgi:hypothetical protein
VRRNLICVVSVCSLLLAVGVVTGCGDSESENPSEAQLEKAKEEGERVAEERARVDELEKEVRNLKRSARRSKAGSAQTAVTATPEPASENGGEDELLRTFHAPSGNVSCAITSTGAFCTVASIATTFRLQNGEAGQTEAGSVLPRGSGELAGYGSTVSAGSVTCTVPEADEQRGIVCVDAISGHGFEASRVGSRQDVY